MTKKHTISDLYDMNFQTDMSEEEYLRETYYRTDGIKSKKALFIVCAGKSMKSLIETGEKSAMETVMLGDRIRNRAKEKEMGNMVVVMVDVINE